MVYKGVSDETNFLTTTDPGVAQNFQKVRTPLFPLFRGVRLGAQGAELRHRFHTEVLPANLQEVSDQLALLSGAVSQVTDLHTCGAVVGRVTPPSAPCTPLLS